MDSDTDVMDDLMDDLEVYYMQQASDSYSADLAARALKVIKRLKRESKKAKRIAIELQGED